MSDSMSCICHNILIESPQVNSKNLWDMKIMSSTRHSELSGTRSCMWGIDLNWVLCMMRMLGGILCRINRIPYEGQQVVIVRWESLVIGRNILFCTGMSNHQKRSSRHIDSTDHQKTCKSLRHRHKLSHSTSDRSYYRSYCYFRLWPQFM